MKNESNTKEGVKGRCISMKSKSYRRNTGLRTAPYKTVANTRAWFTPFCLREKIDEIKALKQNKDPVNMTQTQLKIVDGKLCLVKEIQDQRVQIKPVFEV